MKLYADESGHEVVRPLEAMVVSALARVEVPAAIWRKHRLSELGAEQAGVLVRAFEADYFGGAGETPRFAAVAPGATVLDRAAALVAAQAQDLRAYDAVQLASAMAAREADPQCATIVCFDARLRVASAAHGFSLLPTV